MRALKILNGIPRMATMTSSSDYYDASITVPSGGYPANSTLTLPNGEGYYGAELRVYKNGLFMEVGVDYAISGSVQPYTRVTMFESLGMDDVVRFRRNRQADILAIYDYSVVPSATITAGDPITLPYLGFYEGADLEVFLNGDFLEPLIDYTYIGSTATRTQIALTFDAYTTDRIRFRKD